MVPLDLHVKGNHGEYDKHYQGDHLLQYLELHQREWTTISLKTNTIGWYL